ncbi:MAG: ectonucleotide pyrophosphatase/phosphodiesterase [Chloroflexi bacterium]|nr:ectonucleotide pyrophosphatase/phosphodiesterase [Chloroflexota bacterium]
MRKAVIICLDGCDPAYLTHSMTPALDYIASSGYAGGGQGVVPSVTNVNHVSILTGTFPEEHGIASNYWYDPATGQGEYVEDGRYLKGATVFAGLKERGCRTALIVTKQKLLRLLDCGADVAIAVEAPPTEVIAAVGPPQPIYSAEIDYWTLDALAWTLREQGPDFAYVTTTDYTFHMHGPTDEEAQRHMGRLDERIGRLLTDFPDYALYITADHGMADKTHAIDPARLLARDGIHAVFVPPIKDRYRVHHGDMGGVGYLYVDEAQRAEATAALLAAPGVERVLTRQQAVAEFRLPGERIGDLVLLADPHTVFGELEAPLQEVRLRSHGSHYERAVPILAHQSSLRGSELAWNMDVLKAALRDLEVSWPQQQRRA